MNLAPLFSGQFCLARIVRAIHFVESRIDRDPRKFDSFDLIDGLTSFFKDALTFPFPNFVVSEVCK